MTGRLEKLLAEKPVLVADGAMGTNLFAAGLMTGDSPELWNVEHPERVAEVHRGFVEAGADIILTNTFGGTRHRLKLHDAQGRVAELNQAGARIAREVADAAGRTVAVAGSMGPTGELMMPLGLLTPEDAVDAFAEQAAALKEGGADVLWIETMSAREELTAAAEAARKVGLPFVCTMTFDTNARTMMGVTPEEFARICAELGDGLVGFGANCGVGPAELLHSLLGIGAAAPEGAVLVAKGNCGIPQYAEGKIHYGGTPELMASYARLAQDAGARIVGGCCGSTFAHLRAIARSLAAHTPEGRPDLARLTELLGEPWAKRADAPPSDASAGDGGRTRRRRRA